MAAPYHVIYGRLCRLFPELAEEQVELMLARLLVEVAADEFRESVEADLAALEVTWGDRP